MANSYFCIISVLLVLAKYATAGCYTSIFAFGDSLSDNGNLLVLSAPKIIPQGRSPNGETYFHRPTGRSSDGRLIVDFIAQSFGLPIPPPSVGVKKENREEIYGGLNFAVAGARALNSSFFADRGIAEPNTNVTLGTQLDWFKEVLPSLCSTKTNCRQILKSSLIVMGEIGGNDYNPALLQGRSLGEVVSFVPLVVDEISSAITEMIEFGSSNIIVPGNLPIGCLAAYLAYFQSSMTDSDYDRSTGCINRINELSKYHNHMLQIELDQLRHRYPHATIVYADFYNSAMRLYRSPRKFGFSGSALSACCGAGGPYNYDPSAACGNPPTTACDDPSTYICWDGLHLTETASRLVVQGLFEGPYSIPPMDSMCPSLSATM